MYNKDFKKFHFHILIIDDDQKIRLLLKKFLENNGFRVSDAENTQQAKKIMKMFIFDLLVIDIMMQGQNGLEFLKEIRQTNSIPTLMLTAMSNPEDRLDGLEFGADDYMTKPFEPRELLLRIQNILKRHPENSNQIEKVHFSDSNLTLLVSRYALVIIGNVTANKWTFSRNKNAFSWGE